jgi:hypothetical protein
MCDVAETTQWQQSLGTPNATERVEASVFAGSSACVKCYASVSDVTPEQAKQSLLDQDQQLRTSPGEEGPTYALWVVPGEIWWDTGQTRSIHYILRGPDGWERHKIATDVEGRKHHDPRLFAALAAHLPEP